MVMHGGESGSGTCMEASCAGSFSSSSKAAALEKQLATTTRRVDSEQMKAPSKENERVRRCEAELQETARIFGDRILVASLCCLLYTCTLHRKPSRAKKIFLLHHPGEV